MNTTVIPIVAQDAVRQRKREAPKGRRASDAARAAVRELLGDEAPQRELLIEHLHKLQDRFGHLSTDHLAALAQEMKLAQTEVFEVASFYHHFDIVREGEAAPPALTVRVCDGLSCEMAGARELLARLPALLGTTVRVLAAPCIGRCEQAPAAVIGQHALARASIDSVSAAVQAGSYGHRPEPLHRPGGLQGAGAATACCSSASPANTMPTTSSRHSRPRACAGWAAPASRRGASGASCATKPHHG